MKGFNSLVVKVQTTVLAFFPLYFLMIMTFTIPLSAVYCLLLSLEFWCRINVFWFFKEFMQIQNNPSGSNSWKIKLTFAGSKWSRSSAHFLFAFVICPVQCQRVVLEPFQVPPAKRRVTPQTDHQSITGFIQTRTGMYIHSQGHAGVIHQPGVTGLWENAKAPGGCPHRGYGYFR